VDSAHIISPHQEFDLPAVARKKIVRLILGEMLGGGIGRMFVAPFSFDLTVRER
jgi:hypothetical protein